MTERRPLESYRGSGVGELEQEARGIASVIGDAKASPSRAVIEGEIAFTLEQIEQVQKLRQQLERSLLRTECYVDTELMQMEQRTPRYSPYRFPERAKLQRRLEDIERERRRLAVEHQFSVQRLHERLLTLLSRRRQLTG